MTVRDAPLPRRLRIVPPRSWQMLSPAELWQYRELLFFFVWRDVKVRYKQTVLGAAWAVLQPLATTALFTVFFGRLAGLSRHVDGPYALHVYVGLLPWTFFANAVTLAGNSLVGSSHLISKVYFPRVLVPAAAIVGGLVDFAIAFAFLLVLMGVYGAVPPIQALLFPLFLLGTLGAAAGAGLLFAALIVEYRDFRYVMAFATQLWMFATPVLYPLSIVPAKWQTIYAINPMVGMIAGFRWSLLGTPFAPTVLLVSTISAAALLAVGLRYFLQVERRFADII